jgi:hypothetical protein
LHIEFRIVDTDESGRAFKWHRAFAASHEAIYPRDRSTFERLIVERSVWCAVSSDGEYVAMSYAAFSEEDHEWEIGGLMVSEGMRGRSLGSIMMRLPLASMLFNEQPLSWRRVPKIVAHVLASNDAPRRIILDVGFVHYKPVEISAEKLPGLKADPDGIIRGDEFHLKIPEALHNLADWFDSWDGKLLDGTDSSVDLLPGLTLADWAAAFRDMTLGLGTDHTGP